METQSVCGKEVTTFWVVVFQALTRQKRKDVTAHVFTESRSNHMMLKAAAAAAAEKPSLCNKTPDSLISKR